MNIVQVGKSIGRIIPKSIERKCNLEQILEPVRPHINLTFENILAHINTIYVLKTKDGVLATCNTYLRFKVQTYSDA